MNIILKEDIAGLGYKNDVVKVTLPSGVSKMKSLPALAFSFTPAE